MLALDGVPAVESAWLRRRERSAAA